MSIIEQIQFNFAKAVFDRSQTQMMQYIRPSHCSAEFRFNIYRNNIIKNLSHALETTFPAIWKLIGRECAHHIASLFCQQEINLPQTNNLDEWGEKFPGFLQKNSSLKGLVYLKDIAEYEWLKYKSYRAPNFKLLNPLELKKKLERFGELRLYLNPSLNLLSSLYSLKEVVGFLENPLEGKTIDLQNIPSYAVIYRQNSQVETQWISQDLFHFITLIKNRIPLIKSYEMILENNPQFDLIMGLEFMIKNHLLWKCQRT
ncbi:DNA-binding domain-containing protein [Legionella wadsworthii]|nr:DNA-binding domain-containing protein [Legionella wadsworthii]